MTALSIFLIIGAVGFGFLVISLVFGEVFELFGLDFHSGDFNPADGGHGFIDSRVVSVFVTAFGGFGALGASRYYDSGGRRRASQLSHRRRTFGETRALRRWNRTQTRRARSHR